MAEKMHGKQALLATVLVCALVSLWEFREYFAGLDIASPDMTLYWEELRRYYFATHKFWFDACANGLSLAANPILALFYVGNWPHLFFSFGTAERVAYWAHYPWLGLGLGLWARRLGLAPWGAAAAAGLFAASGLVESMLYRSVHAFWPLCWWPFVAYFSLRYRNQQKALWAVGAGLAAGTGVMAGDPVFLVYALMAVFAAPWTVVPGSRRWLQFFAFFSLATFATCGLALINALAALQLSDRSHGLTVAEVTAFSFHPYRLGEFFLDIFGQPGTPGFTGLDYANAPRGLALWWYPSVYFGLPALLVWTAGFLHLRRERAILGYCTCAALLLLYAFGRWNPAAVWLIENMSLLRAVRYPAKAVLPAMLLLFPVLVLGCTAVYAKLKKLLGAYLHPWVLGAVCGTVLLLPPLLHSSNFRYAPADFSQAPSVLAAVAGDKSGSARVIVDDAAPVSDLKNALMLIGSPLRWGVASHTCPDASLNENQLIAVEDFGSAAARAEFGLSHAVVRSPLAAAFLPGVTRGELRQISPVADDGLILLAATAAPPRWVLLPAWQRGSPSPALAAVNPPSMEPKNAYFSDQRCLAPASIFPAEECPAVAPPSAGVCASHVTGSLTAAADAGSFVTEADCPTLFALNTRFMPGWHASIDEQPRSLYALNEIMLALPVEPGRHQLKFWFTPPLVGGMAPVSLALQYLTVLLTLVALWGEWGGGSKRAPEPSPEVRPASQQVVGGDAENA